MSTRKAFRDLIIVTTVTLIGFFLAYIYLYGRGRFTNSYEKVVDPLGSQFLVIQRVSNVSDFQNNFASEVSTLPNVQLAYFFQLPDQSWEELLDKILTHLKNLNDPPATFISITAYTKGIEHKLIERIKNAKTLSRVFFHSPHENVAREIHRELPTVPLVVSRAEASRLYLMSTLKLEALPRLEGQIFWADFIKEENNFSLNLLNELKKRHVPTLFGPANNEVQWKRLIDLKFSGIITDDAPKMISWLKTRQNQQ